MASEYFEPMQNEHEQPRTPPDVVLEMVLVCCFRPLKKL